jgi:hypothetical protein
MKNKNFIERANFVHNYKYDYSLVNYVNNETKVKIICHEHGVFEQEPKKHINRKQNCPKCSGHKIDYQLFVQKSKEIHNNKYDYSSVIFTNSTTKVKIMCPEHGEFIQTPNAHLSGKECFLCSGTPKKTIKQFISEAILKHDDKYNYSLVNYVNNETKIKVICPEHGEFMQTPASHLSGSGCPKCRESKGEKKIREYLIKNKINFIPQKRFIDCKNILPLPFGFYLPDYNTCIEFNGRQHYLPVKVFGGVVGFNKTITNDKIKTKYCVDNKIKLKIIKYDEDIIDKLNNLF